MIPSRPLVAIVFAFIGGILIVLGGAFFLLSPSLLVFGTIGVACGAIVLVSAAMTYIQPARRVAWAVLIIVFGFASLLSLGGFVIGMILAVVGGALSAAWSPGFTQPWTQAGPPQGWTPGGPASGYSPAPPAQGWTSGASPPGLTDASGPYGVPVAPWRLCMGCGRWIPWAYNICPLCGTAAPVAAWVPRAPAPSAPSAVPWVPPIAPPPFAALPQPAAPAPPPIKAACPTCEGEAVWMAAQGRWYCPAEARYF